MQTKTNLLFRTFVFITLLLTLFACQSEVDAPKPKEKHQASEHNSGQETKQTKLQELTQKLAQDSLSAALYVERAQEYVQQNSGLKAYLDLQKAVDLEPKNELYLLALGNAAFRVNKTRASKEAWEACLELNASNVSCRLKLAELFYFVKDYETCVEFCNQVLSINPEKPSAELYKGLSFMETGDTTKAIRSLQKAIEIEPDFTKAMGVLAELYASQNDPLALDYYNLMLTKDSTRTDVLFNKAYYYQQTNQFDLAMMFYEQAYAINPSFLGLNYNIGYLYSLKKDYDKAIEFFTKGLDSHANNSNHSSKNYFARAYMYELLGNIGKAESDYKSTLMLNPKYSPAQEALNRIKK
ncbi:MAG: tetratricopeptide repeat protein [Flavobacteriales bacterium]